MKKRSYSTYYEGFLFAKHHILKFYVIVVNAMAMNVFCYPHLQNGIKK